MFTATPVNFQRFVDMARSSSRSLSPERELRQMTGHGDLWGMTQAPLPQDSTKMVYDGSTAVGVGGAQVCGSLLLPSVPYRLKSAAAVGSSSSRSTSTTAAATGAPAMGLSASFSRHHSLSDSECVGIHGQETVVLSQDALDEGESVDGTVHATAATAVARVVPAPWQYGSPLYDAVTEKFFCWDGHPLRVKPRSEYGAVEGISCDFCGFTHWITMPDDAEKVGRKGKGVTKKGKQGGKLSHMNHHHSNSNSRNGNGLSYAPPETVVFFTCDTCGVDLCPRCLDDVHDDERYHVPCMCCTRCHAYVRYTEAAVHRCSNPSRTPYTVTGSVVSALMKREEEEKAEAMDQKVKDLFMELRNHHEKFLSGTDQYSSEVKEENEPHRDDLSEEEMFIEDEDGEGSLGPLNLLKVLSSAVPSSKTESKPTKLPTTPPLRPGLVSVSPSKRSPHHGVRDGGTCEAQQRRSSSSVMVAATPPPAAGKERGGARLDESPSVGTPAASAHVAAFQATKRAASPAAPAAPAKKPKTTAVTKPTGSWELVVFTASEEDAEAVERIQAAHGLSAASGTENQAVFYVGTRLAAEKCAGSARAAGLETRLTRV